MAQNHYRNKATQKTRGTMPTPPLAPRLIPPGWSAPWWGRQARGRRRAVARGEKCPATCLWRLILGLRGPLSS